MWLIVVVPLSMQPSNETDGDDDTDHISSGVYG